MPRFLNLESLALVLGLFVAGLGAAWLAHAGLGLSVLAGVLAAVILILPVGAWVQDKLIPFYVARGWTGRALDLALQIRDSALNRRMRDLASMDVALVHCARGDFANALTNLRSIHIVNMQSPAREVVLGHIGYCLAHLDRELDVAEAHAEEAHKALPDIWAFGYFLGLARLKRGNAAEAARLIKASLEQEPDAAQPLPGERPLMLARALKAAGDAAGAAKALDQASKAKGRFGDIARAEAAGGAGGAA